MSPLELLLFAEIAKLVIASSTTVAVVAIGAAAYVRAVKAKSNKQEAKQNNP